MAHEKANDNGVTTEGILPRRESFERKLTKAMGYARLYQLSREDRLGLAEMILRRDVTSWKYLSEPDLVRLLDALEGYALITHLVQTASKSSTA